MAEFFVEGDKLCHHMDDNNGAHNAFFFLAYTDIYHVHTYMCTYVIGPASPVMRRTRQPRKRGDTNETN